MKFKYFTLLAEYPSEVDGTPTIYFQNKNVDKLCYHTDTFSAPNWASDEKGYVHGSFWPSDAGELWISHKMEQYANELNGGDYDYYYHISDNIGDYYFR